METGREELRLSGHSSRIIGITFSPDGQQIATSSEEGTTKIWDVDPAGGELFKIAAHKGNVHDAVYSPEGSKIASTGEDGTVKVWEAATGKLLHSLPGQMDWVNFPAFDSDGQKLAAANRNGGITIWDPDSERELITLSSDSPILTAVTFSPDGQQLAASGEDGVVTIWDATTGERLVNFNHDSGIMRLVYSLDGKLIWTYDRDGWAISWDPIRGERVSSNLSQSIGVCDTVLWDAEFNSDGRYWAAAGFDGLVHVYAANDEQEYLHPSSEVNYSKVHTLIGHVGNVSGVAFHPDNAMLATSGFDGTVRLWDMKTGKEIATLSNSTPSLGGVDFSPDGRYLVTAGSDGTVSVYAVSIEELMEVARSQLSRGFTDEECRTYLHEPMWCPDE